MGTTHLSIQHGARGDFSISLRDEGIECRDGEAITRLSGLQKPSLVVSLEDRVSEQYQQVLERPQELEEYVDPTLLQMRLLVPLDAVLKFCERGINAPAIGAGRAVLNAYSKSIDVAASAASYIPDHATTLELGKGCMKTAVDCSAQWYVADKLERLFARSFFFICCRRNLECY